ncbi:MAG: FtsX-like permease family protein [Alphaproteobacteria bacterium]|jgi:putative ABC transport system permease protein|nr:FtsX-like permease family protein [Alphaproteobacteria bacterium]
MVQTLGAGHANVLSAAAVVRRIMKKSHGGIEDFHIVVPQVLLRQAQRTQRVFNVVLGSIAGMLLLVGGVGIMNMMLMNVAERTREIGIRRAVGASRKHIVFQFLFEAILVTVAGGCIGVVMGIGAANAVTAFADWKTVVTAWSILLSIIMAGGVGLLSGLYPAIRAARLDPVEALRYA